MVSLSCNITVRFLASVDGEMEHEACLSSGAAGREAALWPPGPGRCRALLWRSAGPRCGAVLAGPVYGGWMESYPVI